MKTNFTCCVICLCLPQGEKYLVLKKKYRQILQERDSKHAGTEGGGQRHPSPARAASAAQWDAAEAVTSCPPQKEHRDEAMPCGEADSAAEVKLTPARRSLTGTTQQRTTSALHLNVCALRQTFTPSYKLAAMR